MVDMQFFDKSKAQNEVVLERDDYVEDLKEALDYDDDYETVTEEEEESI